MIGWFVIAILVAVLHTSTDLPSVLLLHDVNTLVYAGGVIAWGFLVHQRIVNRQARRHLVIASIFMFILFFSRLVRWKCFRNNAYVSEFSWYFYYVSFTAVPLCAFLAALCVGKTEKDQPLRRAKWLWVLQGAFSVAVLTNPWHQMFFRIQDATHEKYDYGVIFYICFGFGAILAVATIVVIIRRCQIAALRRYWFIPALGMVFFAGLIVWYYALGGSAPQLFGRKLYHLHEVFCLMFIFPFESMIQLGIMPNNSRYALFFEHSPISASIQDEEGNTIYASASQTQGERNEEAKRSTEGEKNTEAIRSTETERRSEKAIHGGRIIWYEDLTAIQGLNEEIQKITEELEEENELIREENSLRSERISYETKNRLYDKIAGAVKEKALAIEKLLTELAQGSLKSEHAVEEKLIRAMILGAYVKRVGNMMLITEESDKVSTKEFGCAVRESLEYFKLTGIPNDFQERGERCVHAKVILLSYELLELLLESTTKIGSLLVILDARKEFFFRIMMETERLPIDAAWREKELSEVNATLHVEYVDDAWRVELRAREVLE